MPVRLIQPYMDQSANTLWWGAQQRDLVANGVADDWIQQASDYGLLTRVVKTATAGTSPNALYYRMNSSSPQTLTINLNGEPEGTVFTVIQEGTGAFTLAGAAGVTINTALSSLISKGRYNVAQAIKNGPQSYIAFGGLGG